MALDLKATRNFDDGDILRDWNKQRKRHENPENKKAISRIAKAARTQGMTYGKYVASFWDEMPEYVPKRKRKK